MLNKGLRDEESIRIENTLKKLHELVFVPHFWDTTAQTQIDEQLKNFGFSLDSLSETEADDCIILLSRCHFDWEQKEKFADSLVLLSKGNQYTFNQKALAIYEHIQKESTTFSFGIAQKIARLKS